MRIKYQLLEQYMTIKYRRKDYCIFNILKDKKVRRESINKRIKGEMLIFHEMTERGNLASWEWWEQKGQIIITEGYQSPEIEPQEAGWITKSFFIFRHLEAYNAEIKVCFRKDQSTQGTQGYGVAFRYQSPWAY